MCLGPFGEMSFACPITGDTDGPSGIWSAALPVSDGPLADPPHIRMIWVTFWDHVQEWLGCDGEAM